jgi:hypothetical protein
MRRRVLLCAGLAATAALTAVPATAGTAADSTVKIKFAADEARDQIGIYAVLKTARECKSPKRKFILLRDGDAVASQNGFSDAFIITDEVAVGDTVEMKAKTARAEDGTKCKGSTSKPFEIKEQELVDG